MKYLFPILFLYACAATYFATFEIDNRIQRYAFKSHGYELVTQVQAPSGIENSYMQQAEAKIENEKADHIAGLLKVRMPRLPDVN